MDLETRENELQKQARKLQEDVAVLQQQQKDFSARQSIYNQQQLEFLSRKHAQASLQFELAERESTLEIQTKMLNESRERLEAERLALEEERRQLHEQNEKLKQDTEALELDKAAFDAEKQAQSTAPQDPIAVQQRYAELQEYERNLAQREAALNAQARELQARSYMANPVEPYSGYSPYEQQPMNPYHTGSLQDAANRDGITLYTTGKTANTSTSETAATAANPQPKKAATYNVGSTLFRAAFIIFCIVAFESLSVFFALDYLGVKPVYPIVGFSLGFVAFMICAILYVCKYKPNAKLKKSASYITTCVILFVIAVIIVTMVAVYLNAQLSVPSKLLSYVIIPTAYLMNIILFAVFYYILSKKDAKK